MLLCLILLQKYKYVFFVCLFVFLICFSVCCSVWVLSIVLYSTSLMHSSRSLSLPVIPSVIAYFIFNWLFIYLFWFLVKFSLCSLFLSVIHLTLLLLLLLSHFSRVRLCVTPETAAHQAPPSLGFSRQEHWSGLPFPSPMHESEK